MGADGLIVAGGAEIYRALIDRCDRLEVTEVALAPEGDATFPPIDGKIWREVRREPHPPGEGDEVPFTFVGYERHNRA
jgi:dihydrofolate reductase